MRRDPSRAISLMADFGVRLLLKIDVGAQKRRGFPKNPRGAAARRLRERRIARGMRERPCPTCASAFPALGRFPRSRRERRVLPRGSLPGLRPRARERRLERNSMRWSIGNFPMRAPRNRVLIWFHSSSASRVTAGAAGFLTFIQSPRGHLDRVTPAASIQYPRSQARMRACKRSPRRRCNAR